MLGPSPEHPGGITKAVAAWRDGGLDRLVSVRSIHTSRWDDPRPRQALQAAAAMGSLLLALLGRRVDVVLLHVSTGGSAFRKLVAALLARLFRVPYVVQIHSGDFEGWVARSALGRACSRSLFSHAAASIVVSRRWVDLARRLGAGDVVVLPNALPAAERRALAPAARPHEQPASPPTILYYGRWSPIKGPDRIAPALAAAEGPFHLRLFGNGDRDWLERSLSSLPPESWTLGGWIGLDQKATELARATVLVVPSRAEGFGQVLLEARAAGTPVVASDVGAVSEVLDGYAPSLLVPAGDDAALAAALARVVAGDWPDPSVPREPDLPERFHAEHAARSVADLLARVGASPRARRRRADRAG